MNNNFSTKRFGQFACAEFRANGRQFILSVLTVTIISLVIFSLYYTAKRTPVTNIDLPFGFSIATVIVATLFYASLSFKKYFNRSKAVEAFMIPASKSEKFTYHFLQNAIVFPFVSILIVLLITETWSLSLGIPLFYSEMIGEFWDYIIVAFNIVATLSIFFLGAIIFRRLQFLFTLLSIGALISIFTTLCILTSDMQFWNTFGQWLTSLLRTYSMDELETISGIVVFSGSVLVLAITVPISWVKFKKLQSSK